MGLEFSQPVIISGVLIGLLTNIAWIILQKISYIFIPKLREKIKTFQENEKLFVEHSVNNPNLILFNYLYLLIVLIFAIFFSKLIFSAPSILIELNESLVTGYKWSCSTWMTPNFLCTNNYAGEKLLQNGLFTKDVIGYFHSVKFGYFGFTIVFATWFFSKLRILFKCINAYLGKNNIINSKFL